MLIHYLRHHIPVEDLSLDKIISCFKPISVKRGGILLSEGEICKEFYFVSKGCVRTYYLNKQAQEKTRYLAFENSVVSAITSFISQQPSFEFVDVPEDSELYVISRDDFYRLQAEVPGWSVFYTKLLESAYVYQNKKIENLVTLSAKQRYEKLMEETPHYMQKVSNKILASYLDMTQETLSRLKSK